MAFPPYTFANQSGNVPAQELDSNFSACLPASVAATTIYGNNTSFTGNAAGLTPSQVYGMLKVAWPVELTMFMSGLQAVNAQQLLRYSSIISNVVITQGFCIASCGANPTVTAVFTVADNGSNFGTISLNTSGVPTITITGTPYTLLLGHVLTITGPATADATLGNVNITLGGARS